MHSFPVELLSFAFKVVFHMSVLAVLPRGNAAHSFVEPFRCNSAQSQAFSLASAEITGELMLGARQQQSFSLYSVFTLSSPVLLFLFLNMTDNQKEKAFKFSPLVKQHIQKPTSKVGFSNH